MYVSTLTSKGNSSYSDESQEHAEQLAAQLDANGCENCEMCIDCKNCKNCVQCSRCVNCHHQWYEYDAVGKTQRYYAKLEETRELTDLELNQYFAEVKPLWDAIEALPPKKQKNGYSPKNQKNSYPKHDEIFAKIRACQVKHGVVTVVNDMRKLLSFTV